jgi:predicted metal-dependent peptidase
MDELTIVADSSGSMFTKEIFERIAVAVNHIVTVIKPLEVRVIWADDKDCSNVDVFADGEDVVLHPKGGGGTDMRKPLAYVEQYSPEVVLLLTDGYTPWPDMATPYPLIIGCTTDAPCPDWAGVVRIEVQ